MQVLNAALHAAEGRIKINQDALNELVEYLKEAKRREDIVRNDDKLQLFTEDLNLGFGPVRATHMGVRLLEIAKHAQNKEILSFSSFDIVLEPIAEWLKDPKENDRIHAVLADLFDVNYRLPDNSPSAMKRLTA